MKLFRTQFNRLVIAIVLGMVSSTSANAAKQSWSTLTPMQQEALAPVAKEWKTMPETQQKRLLATTKSYAKLSPELKQRFQTRLTEWSKLTPEQRNRAREKYQAFHKIPKEKREEVKRMVLQTEAEKNAATTASSDASTTDK